MLTYYNEHDPFAAQWLNNLRAEKLIPYGLIDTRDIKQVPVSDPVFNTHKRAHFFAGIAGWELALNLARFPNHINVWTGSCPCQPFSIAGKRKGNKDERHLWPHWKILIDYHRPAIVFGEQTQSKDGLAWLSGVRSDLEGMGYGVGAADLCAASVSTAQRRQRLFWGAVHSSSLARPSSLRRQRLQERSGGDEKGPGGETGAGQERGPTLQSERVRAAGPMAASPLAGSLRSGLSTPQQQVLQGPGREEQGRAVEQFRGAWRDARLLLCTDGKARRVGASVYPLAHGVPGRVGRLRAYGNAIVPQVAAEFVAAFMEVVGIEPEEILE